MCACPKERKRLLRGIQSYRWRSGTRSTVNMLSSEFSSPHLNADGHTYHQFVSCHTRGSSIACPVFVRGNTRRNYSINVAHFYQVTCAVPSCAGRPRPRTLYLILYSLALRLGVQLAEGRRVRTTYTVNLSNITRGRMKWRTKSEDKVWLLVWPSAA